MNNTNWLEGLFRTIDAKDYEGFVGFLTDDATFKMGNMPPMIGKPTIRQGIEAFFGSIKALSHTGISSWAVDNTVIMKGTVTYTRHNDTQLSVGFCNIFEMDGERIRNYAVFIDSSELYK